MVMIGVVGMTYSIPSKITLDGGDGVSDDDDAPVSTLPSSPTACSKMALTVVWWLGSCMVSS